MSHTDDVRDIVATNTQKGETYRMVFRDDPTRYEGIPVAVSPIITSKVNVFDFKVLEPKQARGVQRRTFSEVISLEKC